MDLELALHLEVLGQVEVLVLIGVELPWPHLFHPQEQKEHIQIDHLENVDVLDSLHGRGRHAVELFGLFFLLASALGLLLLVRLR